ncbi:S-adenosyl-L-methionine-dependent methyltransferase [Sporormia fimetaria CBS 119925]|uniref:S-adenosyl-L-methionine-dependent methyltransferase n=1 Tax=Sporormia fimetaria CBS 119925 TaxID=1340428 RepID=A0A6A6V930_9PLEO|nr:S-adenosyl-L-methionine-dependent methyltransferase [Sporormia fimetaria CBS 119925]
MAEQNDTNERTDRWTAVDHYTFNHLHANKPSATPSPSSLQHALSTSQARGLPDIAVSPSQGKFLKLQAQIARAKNILEIGTLGGYSTIWLASAGPDVSVVSIEVSEKHAEIARANIAHAEYAERVDVVVGAGLDVLPRLVEEVGMGRRERFDFLFVDADKENNWAYVDLSLGMMRRGAVVVVDNVVRKGQLARDDTGDSRVEGVRKLIESVGMDDRLDGVVLQTVGEKSYDGFLMAIVNS